MFFKGIERSEDSYIDFVCWYVCLFVFLKEKSQMHLDIFELFEFNWNSLAEN